MIPILFESTETQFDTNGLGRMSDATRCVVTEERNGAYELEMDYPIHGNRYSSIGIERILFAVPSDGAEPQPFSIYKVSKPISGIVTVYARHITYRLSMIPTKRFTTAVNNAADALRQLKSNAMISCPFDFWTDVDTVAAYTTPEVSSIRSRLGGVEGSVLDCFGGEYEWDRWAVKLHKARGADNGVTIRYGKNLTNVVHEIDIETTVTGVVAFWKSEDMDGNEQYVSSDIVSTGGEAPFQKVTVLDMSAEFDDLPTVAQLNTAAVQYAKTNSVGQPRYSTEISFVPLWQTEEYQYIAPLERVNLCDTVHVEYPELGVSVQAKVTRTDYDVLAERYNSIELGDSKPTLADTIVSQQKAIKRLSRDKEGKKK